MRRLALLGSFIAIAGCGGSGEIEDAIAPLITDWVVLDTVTGTVETRSALPELATDPAYTTTKIAFRVVPAQPAAPGDTAGFAAQPDEGAPGTAQRTFISAFEITQAQWLALGGADAWSATAADLGWSAGLGSDRPATGMSRDQAAAVLAAWSAGSRPDLALPTDAEWEAACRAGTATDFSWGNDRSDPTAARYALVWETTAGRTGAEPVATRTANALGIHAMHGNVWEWTGADTIRGGAWRDSLPQARSANRAELDSAVGHPLVGLRLVLRP
jgi:formylglycine-generating enzyme required for sulfatase activity